MSNDPPPSSGRLGWLFAALLFGVLAGGGIAWMLINRHPDSPSVVIYQMPTPSPTASPDNSSDRLSSNQRRHHRTVHPAEDLPSALEGTLLNPVPTPTPDLAAGIDEPASPPPGRGTPSVDRQTVLVDGIAITRPPNSPAPSPGQSAGRVVFDPNSAGVDDSLTFALEAMEKYIKSGFNVREDAWGGELTTGKAKAITSQLFKGNDYWFCIGSSAAGSSVRVRLYDHEGNPADSNYWQHTVSDGSYAAAEIQCQRTGTYFVVVSADRAPEERLPWGVVYAYR